MDIIEAIKKAEIDAEEKKIQAEKQVNQIIKDSKELACNKANDILNQAREESKILIEKNKNKVDAEVVKFIDENKESDDKLIDHSRSNVENAVDAIMKFII